MILNKMPALDGVVANHRGTDTLQIILSRMKRDAHLLSEFLTLVLGMANSSECAVLQK